VSRELAGATTEIDEVINRVLAYAHTVAVVGASKDPQKAGGRIPRDLQRHGFRVIPVNPSGGELFGETVRPSLTDTDETVDVVDVFRPAEEAPEIARQAVAMGARALWLQLGITSAEAREIAAQGGLDYVEDRCMGAESDRRHIRKG
jgi:predicted CoA-binding protein